MAKGIKTIDKIMNGILTYIVIAMLSVMSVVVFAQVIFRLAHASIPWSEELSRYMMIWTTFLGSALCVRKGSLVGLEILYKLMPSKGANIIFLCIHFCSAAFLVLLIYIGFQTSFQVWSQQTAVLKLPMGAMYGAIPIGSVFMLFNTGIVLFERFAGKEGTP